ncbi:MotA/TolQ/ExbB proton channel family protein [Candidatus Magnetominusculus dajiuhuensis]|uniref:MotA/TolQ/ExbB proton channel family protein n=1 Tax=Candidatus Magnetominusculus dajiuhuensis TaxID=3137712 RepID=UPI003B42D8CE
MEYLMASLQALRLGGLMVYPLFAMGVLVVAILLDRTFVNMRYCGLPGQIVDIAETYGFQWELLQDRMASLARRSFYRRFFQVILDNRSNPAWWVESRAVDEAQLIEQALNRGLWILETIVTAAPLVGLVGTIIGMMESFKLIGTGGLVNPTGITGGVAQALIATTLGIVIALIALFSFNFFSHIHANTMDKMERLGTRLIDRLRIDEGNRGGA